jgi:hypothetical protein
MSSYDVMVKGAAVAEKLHRETQKASEGLTAADRQALAKRLKLDAPGVIDAALSDRNGSRA